MSFWRGASHTYRVRGRLALLARLYRHKDTSHLNITLKASIYIRPIEQILKVIYTETLFDWSRLQIMNKIAYEMSRPRVRGCTVVWAGWGRCAGGFIAGKYLASIPLDTSPPLLHPIGMPLYGYVKIHLRFWSVPQLRGTELLTRSHWIAEVTGGNGEGWIPILDTNVDSFT